MKSFPKLDTSIVKCNAQTISLSHFCFCYVNGLLNKYPIKCWGELFIRFESDFFLRAVRKQCNCIYVKINKIYYYQQEEKLIKGSKIYLNQIMNRKTKS